jgi:hypothetical protein
VKGLAAWVVAVQVGGVVGAAAAGRPVPTGPVVLGVTAVVIAGAVVGAVRDARVGQ